MADEREIHKKLNQILNLLDEIQNEREMEQEFEPTSEEKFSQKLCEDVFDSEGKEADLDMYLIQTDELDFLLDN